MNISLVNLKYSLLSTAMSCVLLSHGAEAKVVGVFALFESKSVHEQSKLITEMEHRIKQLGCIVRREGKILAAQGNYDVPDVNGFFLMECESSFLQNSQSQRVIDEFKHSVENFALLEGAVTQFGGFGLAESGNDNSYIFKLSDYNNTSPRQRNVDLMKLDSLVKTRPDRYKTEAFLRVQDAYGMKRPDEVVVIYYDSAGAGERFRSNDENGDVMKLIGTFNNDHLTQASYLVAQSNR